MSFGVKSLHLVSHERQLTIYLLSADCTMLRLVHLCVLSIHPVLRVRFL
jgi:hypothetical protein